MRRSVVPILAAVLLAAGCSSSKPSSPAFQSQTTDAIGQTKAATSQGPEASAALGSPITKGALRITMSGPVTAVKANSGLEVKFNVTMTDTAASGSVDGPENFMVRCDANRDDPDKSFGTYWAATTAAGLTVNAGKTATGTAVVGWVTPQQTVRCTGAATVEAQWPMVGYLAWTLPVDVVAQVNKTGGV